MLKCSVNTQGNFFLPELAAQRQFKRNPFPQHLYSLQNKCVAGHNNLRMSKVLQEPTISFSPKFALQIARKICLRLRKNKGFCSFTHEKSDV